MKLLLLLLELGLWTIALEWEISMMECITPEQFCDLS